MPENEEACPGSIWVTDEYEVIRNGESRIQLPVWRVSWVESKVRGAWEWVAKVLSSGVQKRGLVEDAQVVVSEAAGELRDEVARKMDVWTKVWGLCPGVAEDGDEWAVSRGSCER